MDNIYSSGLPLLTVLLPLVGFLLILLSNKKNEDIGFGIATLSNLLSLLSLGLLMPQIFQGKTVVFQISGVFPPFGFEFEVGMIGFVMAFLSNLLWLMATLYSRNYIRTKGNGRRYYAFLSLTLTGCLGVYLTGELFSLFVFFEILSLASFVLVIHNEDEDGIQAGYLYLFMGIFGGLLLLFGMSVLYAYGSGYPLSEMVTQLPDRPLVKYGTALLLIFGFGVKAGIFPVHIWLPQAHPVAPSPASALLSGVMIKAGAYGIFLTLHRLFFHDQLIEQLGYLVAWIGLITMLLGAVSALRQKDAKRLLAYSSISQIGYIVLALGLAAYLGEHGQMGFLGAFFHVMNHAIFKVGFFLNIGIIYLLTHTKNLDELGGLLPKMPLIALNYLIFAGGIIGIPGFNGYGSKTLIHHALSEAIHYQSDFGLVVMEKLFILTGAFTFAYISKLFINIFLGDMPQGLKIDSTPTLMMRGIVVVLSLLVLIVGIIPKYLVENLLFPMSQETSFNLHVGEEFFDHYSFWNIHDLSGIIPYILIGTALYLLDKRYNLINRMVPKWFGISQLVNGLIHLVSFTFTTIYYGISNNANKGREMIRGFALNYVDKLIHFDRDPRKTRIGPVSIASLDFSKLWVAVVLVVFLMLTILKLINLGV